jgi:hypoxanthine phosphoribosyltransferase
MQPIRKEVLTWDDVDRLIDHLVPQFDQEFEAMVLITRGGLVPGGLMAEAMGLMHILTAAVDFPAQMEMEQAKLMAWTQFIQFPEERMLRGRRALIVDDV